MRFLSLIFFAFLLFSNSAQADYDNLWLELGHSLSGTSVNIKAIDDEFNWAIEGAVYYSPLFTLYEDRETNETDNTKFSTLSMTKNWTLIGKLGYLDVGAGLGVGNGSWVTSCSEAKHGGFLTTTELCDVHEGTRIGIPLHASAVFGRYFGIGITARAFITSGQSYANLMITLPFGNFTK
jgi:hypothetical protein